MKFYERIGVYGLAIAMSFMFTACDEDDQDDGPTEETEDPTPNTGTVKDAEGNTYSTVVIGELEWMSENLRSSSAQGLVVCYDEEDENCGIYGNMYDLTAVTQGQAPSTSRVQGVCPDGWFIPRRDDYSFMVNNTAPGGVNWNSNQLKANSDLWFGSGAGNNESGFAALPGGRLNLVDDGAGGFTYSFFDLAQASHLWWVGHIENPNQFHAGTFTLSAGSNTISYGDMNAESTVLNNRAAPCRCVRPL